MIAKTLYNVLAYPPLSLGAGLGALVSKKLRTGLEGRVGLAERAARFRAQHAGARLVLFHCASAGELEGIKPLAAACRSRGWLCAVSYFSPSALTAASGTDLDFADYSPRDSVSSAQAYLKALQPDVVLISKHDVWPNMVWQARRLNIPIWLINGNFHAGSSKLIPGLRQFHRAIYSELTGILTVSQDDARRAAKISGIARGVHAVGDSRFDRVVARARSGTPIDPAIKQAIGERPTIVAGSSHERDEELLIAAFVQLRRTRPDACLLIVPHDPSEQALSRIVAHAQAANLIAAEAAQSSARPDIVIVNRTGVLADLYRLGGIAFVGGGFDRGVHSVLEPMAHGLEVLCGPNIGVSREAGEGREQNLLAVVQTADELSVELSARLSSPSRDAVLKFVFERSGVVDRILDLVLP